MKNFTNKYQLSKTLRFELKPIGKTKDHIEAKGFMHFGGNVRFIVNCFSSVFSFLFAFR